MEGSDLCLPQWETGVMLCVYVCTCLLRLRSDGDSFTTCHVCSILINNFGNAWASRKNILDASATPSGIKREWYVCMYVEELYSRVILLFWVYSALSPKFVRTLITISSWTNLVINELRF
jgi:hypothetical protein